MKEKKTEQPKVRFKEFTDAWELRRLGEIAKLGSSKRVHRENYVENGVPFFRGSEISKLGSSSKLEDVLYISKEQYEQLKEKYGVPKIDDILITAVGTLGNSFVITDGTPFYFKDGNLIWLSEIKIYSQFLNIYLSDGIGKRRVLESAAGSNQKALTMVKLENVVVPIPSDEEQIKVGSFFKNLDYLITLHQREYEIAQKFKKTMLSKMFPKNGADKPELRFAGFTDAWEQRRLGDITDYIKGFAFKSKDYQDYGIQIIRASDLSVNDIKENEDKIFIDKKLEESFKNYKLNQGEIIITTVGSKSDMKDSAVGRAIFIKDNNVGLLNQNLVKISTKDNYNSFFIYTNLLQKKFSDYIATIERGNANQANIAISDLWEYKIFVPSIEEQTQIGDFFLHLDNLITLHQRELESLKNMKKTFLQQMFV